MRLAHLSDIHFFSFRKNPLQIFSKRLLGNFNFYFTRKKSFDQSLAVKVLSQLKELGISHLIITGDYTCTSSREEFGLMQEYVKKVRHEGFTVFTLPGNHDAYTHKSYHKQIFYDRLHHLVNFQGEHNFLLNRDRVAIYRLCDDYYLILIDCAVASKYTQSIGRFSRAIEARLKEALSHIEKDAKIVVAGHFPFDPFLIPSVHLERGSHLRSILDNDPRVLAYIHGHRHNQEITKRGHLWVADSGSISISRKSSFNLIELKDSTCLITPYRLQNASWREYHVKETS